MKATTWFRISAVILVLFAVGHTIGFMGFRGLGAESEAVRAQMDAVRFATQPGGPANFTFGGFYVGFGLFNTAFYVFAAWVAWRLGAMARRGSPDVAALGWPMVALMIVSAALAIKYFFTPPIVLSVLAAVCLAVGTWLGRKTSAG